MNKCWLLLAIVLALPACTNSEQAEENARRERREAEMRRLQEEQQQRNENTDPDDTVSIPTPVEPEYEEVEYVKYDGTECRERELESCGMLFSDCANGMVYRCMLNVKYSIITKKQLVE